VRGAWILLFVGKIVGIRNGCSLRSVLSIRSADFWICTLVPAQVWDTSFGLVLGPVGREFLVWLLRMAGQARPLSEFYDGGFSHELLRPILQEYVERGLVTWEERPEVMSQRSLRATFGLKAALSEHSVRLASLIQDLGGE